MHISTLFFISPHTIISISLYCLERSGQAFGTQAQRLLLSRLSSSSLFSKQSFWLLQRGFLPFVCLLRCHICFWLWIMTCIFIRRDYSSNGSYRSHSKYPYYNTSPISHSSSCMSHCRWVYAFLDKYDQSPSSYSRFSETPREDNHDDDRDRHDHKKRDEEKSQSYESSDQKPMDANEDATAANDHEKEENDDYAMKFRSDAHSRSRSSRSSHSHSKSYSSSRSHSRSRSSSRSHSRSRSRSYSHSRSRSHSRSYSHSRSSSPYNGSYSNRNYNNNRSYYNNSRVENRYRNSSYYGPPPRYNSYYDKHNRNDSYDYRPKYNRYDRYSEYSPRYSPRDNYRDSRAEYDSGSRYYNKSKYSPRSSPSPQRESQPKELPLQFTEEQQRIQQIEEKEQQATQPLDSLLMMAPPSSQPHDSLYEEKTLSLTDTTTINPPELQRGESTVSLSSSQMNPPKDEYPPLEHKTNLTRAYSESYVMDYALSHHDSFSRDSTYPPKPYMKQGYQLLKSKSYSYSQSRLIRSRSINDPNSMIIEDFLVCDLTCCFMCLE